MAFLMLWTRTVGGEFCISAVSKSGDPNILNINIGLSKLMVSAKTSAFLVNQNGFFAAIYQDPLMSTKASQKNPHKHDHQQFCLHPFVEVDLALKDTFGWAVKFTRTMRKTQPEKGLERTLLNWNRETLNWKW